MKKDLCEIILILDESGSMHSCKSDTIGGVNQFLTTQKKLKMEIRVTLIKFSDYFEIINDAIEIDKIEYLNESNYQPSHSTALFDAVGTTIEQIGKRLAETTEEKRPEKVLFVVITDGFENASYKFSQTEIFKMVTHQKEKYSWEFLFLGADIDTWGSEIGIDNNVKISKNDLKRSYKGLAYYSANHFLGVNKSLSNFLLDESDLDNRLDKL